MTPREKAEACFAKARSTTHANERDNAVTLGIRVAEKAGLDLDTFDIPGRVKARTSPPTRPMYRWGDAQLSPEEREALISAMAAAMQRSVDRAFYEAARRPRYCPHGSDMALFGDSCVICERERKARQ